MGKIKQPKDDFEKYDAVKVQGTRLRSLVGATFGFAIGLSAVSLFGPTVKKLKKDAPEFVLNSFLTGILVASPVFTGSIVRVLCSMLVGAGFSTRKIHAGMFFFESVGLLMFMILLFATDTGKDITNGGGFYTLMLACGMFAGSGIATFTAGIPLTSYWNSIKNQGFALAVYGGLGNISPAVFTLLVPQLVKAIGIEWTYLIWFLLVSLGGAAVVWAIHDPMIVQLERALGPAENEAELKKRRKWCKVRHEQEIYPGGDVFASLKEAGKSWRNWLLTFIYMLTFGAFLGLTSWFPIYWGTFHGFDIQEAGALTALYGFVASLSRVPGGKISDLFGGVPTLIASLVIITAGAVGMAQVKPGDSGWSILCEILIGAGQGVGNAATFKLIPQYLPTAVAGATGWIGGVGAFGGFIVPPVMGAVALGGGGGDLQGYADGYYFLMGWAILSLACTLVLFFLPPEAPPTGSIQIKTAYGSQTIPPGQAGQRGFVVDSDDDPTSKSAPSASAAGSEPKLGAENEEEEAENEEEEAAGSEEASVEESES